jgi:hypothetical protein
MFFLFASQKANYHEVRVHEGTLSVGREKITITIASQTHCRKIDKEEIYPTRLNDKIWAMTIERGQCKAYLFLRLAKY